MSRALGTAAAAKAARWEKSITMRLGKDVEGIDRLLEQDASSSPRKKGGRR